MRFRERVPDWMAISALLAVVLALSLAAALFQPYMEARAYERVTGRPVSMWDAMFLDLRVQSEPESQR